MGPRGSRGDLDPAPEETLPLSPRDPLDTGRLRGVRSRHFHRFCPTGRRNRPLHIDDPHEEYAKQLGFLYLEP